MTDPREALAVLLEREFGQFLAHRPHDPKRFYWAAADAILAAGWTPPGERVKPTEEDVARALAELNEETDWEGGVESYLPDARAVLALFEKEADRG